MTLYYISESPNYVDSANYSLIYSTSNFNSSTVSNKNLGKYFFKVSKDLFLKYIICVPITLSSSSEYIRYVIMNLIRVCWYTSIKCD